MKELFEQLRELMPQERGSKASKWEILTKGTLFLQFGFLIYTDLFSYRRTSKADRHYKVSFRTLPDCCARGGNAAS